jgi:nitrogen fixation protein FixH
MKTLIVIVILVGLLSVAAVIIIGSRSFEGIVTENPYEKGLLWDKSRKEKASSGLNLDVLTKRFATGDNEVLFSVLDREGKPLPGGRVSAEISRPSSTAYDRKLEVEGPKDGVYAASVHFPAEGYWDLRVEITDGGKRLIFEKRILVEKGT